MADDRLQVHHWSGTHASPDAAAAAAILSVHLLQMLEGEASIRCEEQGAESALFRSYLSAGLVQYAPADDPLAVPGGASRVHVGCVLWPRAAEEEVCVLYHVTSGAAAPARLNCGPRSRPVADGFLDEAKGAFVLDTPHFDRGGGGASGRHHLVWGGVHLQQHPASPQRTTALLLAHNLHNQEYLGASTVTVMADGTYQRGDLPIHRVGSRSGVDAAKRCLSGCVTRVFVLQEMAIAQHDPSDYPYICSYRKIVGESRGAFDLQRRVYTCCACMVAAEQRPLSTQNFVCGSHV